MTLNYAPNLILRRGGKTKALKLSKRKFVGAGQFCTLQSQTSALKARTLRETEISITKTGCNNHGSNMRNLNGSALWHRTKLKGEKINHILTDGYSMNQSKNGYYEKEDLLSNIVDHGSGRMKMRYKRRNNLSLVKF